MENKEQTAFFVENDRRTAKPVRCRRCRKILSNSRSIKNHYGADCLRRLRNKDRIQILEENILSIDDKLLTNIKFWCNAMMSHVQLSDDKDVLVRLYEKAGDNKHMSPIVIGAEIDSILEMYDRLKMNRDDILNGLRAIAVATGRKFGGLI